MAYCRFAAQAISPINAHFLSVCLSCDSTVLNVLICHLIGKLVGSLLYQIGVPDFLGKEEIYGVNLLPKLALGNL